MASTSNQGNGSKVRHVRVPNGLWADAAERANTIDGMGISEVVVALLERYARGEIDL